MKHNDQNNKYRYNVCQECFTEWDGIIDICPECGGKRIKGGIISKLGVVEMISQEIKWHRENKEITKGEFGGGFIKGMEQIKFLISKMVCDEE